MSDEVDMITQMVRDDLDKPVCQWTEKDRQDWRDMGWRVPKCKCEKCRNKRL